MLVPRLGDDLMSKISDSSEDSWHLRFAHDIFHVFFCFICFSTINIHHIVGDTSPYVILNDIPVLVGSIPIVSDQIVGIVAYCCVFLLILT